MKQKIVAKSDVFVAGHGVGLAVKWLTARDEAGRRNPQWHVFLHHNSVVVRAEERDTFRAVLTFLGWFYVNRDGDLRYVYGPPWR